MIKDNKELKEIIDKNYPARVDLVEALMQEFPWRFKSLDNGASFLSKKINGHDGLSLSDLMLFELWFKVLNGHQRNPQNLKFIFIDKKRVQELWTCSGPTVERAAKDGTITKHYLEKQRVVRYRLSEVMNAMKVKI